MIDHAAGSEADVVILDLEDSVTASGKDEARATVIDALRGIDWGTNSTAVRINGADTHWAHEDLIGVVTGAGEALDLIVIPKVKGPRDVWWVETLLGQLESRHPRREPVGLEVLIEEVEALTTVEDICRSSPRLEAVIFGSGDFSASQGVRVKGIGDQSADYPGDIWHNARSRIAVAARAARIDPIDGPFAAFGDQDGYRRESLWSRALGFNGKWAIHPSQIPIANDMFTPTRDDEAAARRVITAYEEARSEGLGATSIDGHMIDEATIRMNKAVLERAEMIRGRQTNPTS
jgi:citrate lyase subunit beta/citryl-CoA lyase